MTFEPVRSMVCDDCGDQVLLDDVDDDPHPKYTYFCRGWVEVQRRAEEDRVAVVYRHYCPECVPEGLVR